jgi:uncharacterized integral membrane protein (TIGR00697 family)
MFDKLIEALFVTEKQYKLKFKAYYINKKKQIIVVFQVANKRAKVKIKLTNITANKKMLEELHPVDVCRVGFLKSLEKSKRVDNIPNDITTPFSGSILHQAPTIKIISQSFDQSKQKTTFTLSTIKGDKTSILSTEELMNNNDLLYGLDTQSALTVGYAAGEDFINQKKGDLSQNTAQKKNKNLHYYHILCACYIALSLSGISIVNRLFPYNIPFFHVTLPMCAGMIFYPLTFFIQDITTEVYGYNYSRHMVWLTIFSILFYVLYTQIAIHLPSGPQSTYADNVDFTVVFNKLPRQLLALIVALFTGSLINDYMLSKLKISFSGKYLWARVVCSTMIGEIVLQIVGNAVGFSGTMKFYSQLLPNTLVSYGYKFLWNIALIPALYLLSNFLKKHEGVDIFDYDVNYNPFVVGLTNPIGKEK